MLQELYVLWQPANAAVVVLFAGMALLVNEVMVNSLFPEETWLGHEVDLAVRSIALPNYWVWYSAQALEDMLNAHFRTLIPFLVVTIYNAAICTWAVAAAQIVVLLTVLTRSCRRGSPWKWLWIVPVLSFIFDLLEDLFLLILLMGYPVYKYPQLALVVPWMSLMKFCGWLCTAVAVAGGLLSLFVYGPAPKEHADTQ